MGILRRDGQSPTATMRSAERRASSGHRWVRYAISLVAVTGLSACGSDDSSESAAGSSEFCDIARELFEAEGFPANEKMDQYVELAPAEIKDDATLAIGAIKEKRDAAFDDEKVASAVGRIEKFEAKECGIDRPGD